MSVDLPKRFYLATVEAHPGEPVIQNGMVTVSVPVKQGSTPWSDYYNIQVGTKFIHAPDNQAALESLKPGMNLYIWVEGSDVTHASPVYK
jgi:hypothetical protein